MEKQTICDIESSKEFFEVFFDVHAVSFLTKFLLRAKFAFWLVFPFFPFFNSNYSIFESIPKLIF